MRNAIEPLDEQSSTPQAAVFPLTPNSSADKSTSLVISGIQSGWSSRYVRSCFRAFLSKLRAFNQLPVPTGNEPLLSSSHLPLKRSWDQASAAILLCIAVSFSNTGNIDHYDIGKSTIKWRTPWIVAASSFQRFFSLRWIWEFISFTFVETLCESSCERNKIHNFASPFVN